MSQMQSPCKHIEAKLSKLQALLVFRHCVERNNILSFLYVHNFLLRVKLSVFIIVEPPKNGHKT